MGIAELLPTSGSDFVSIHRLVTDLSAAEHQPVPVIAKIIHNLIVESDSAPVWMWHRDGVTTRMGEGGHANGLQALRALRDGFECKHDLERRMGFLKTPLRDFLRTYEIDLPSTIRTVRRMPSGQDRDKAILDDRDRLKREGVKPLYPALAAMWDLSETTIKNACRNAKKTAAPVVALPTSFWQNARPSK